MKTTEALTIHQITTYCGVDIQTVVRWISNCSLKTVSNKGNTWVTTSDFLDFLKNFRRMEAQRVEQNKPHLLIVDDDNNMAMAIQRALRQQNFEIMLANDGFSAGVLLGRFNPAIITLDINMPGLSGIEFIKFIRGIEHLKDTKILIISAQPRQEIDVCLKAGADDSLTKPFFNETLLNKVEQLFGQHPSGYGFVEERLFDPSHKLDV